MITGEFAALCRPEEELRKVENISVLVLVEFESRLPKNAHKGNDDVFLNRVTRL